jgi:prepilin-type N-terminal cleavage/methylation domain-containing protein
MSNSTAERRDRRAGFTIIEVMIAIVVLGVGVMALVGSSAMVTRMIGAGRTSTEVVEIANSRVEHLRRAAYSTSPPCTHAQFVGGDTTGTGYTEKWTITTQANSISVITDSVVYRTTRGARPFVLTTSILCR